MIAPRQMILDAIRQGKAIADSILSSEAAYDIANEFNLGCVYDLHMGDYCFTANRFFFTREHQIRQGIRVIR